MFPGLNENEEFNSASDFFGGMEVPPYKELSVLSVDNLDFLSDEIKKIGADCTGFIEPDKICYHIVHNKEYYSDFYREYVFIYFKDMNFKGNLPYGFLMKFLQYKSSKILFVYENNSFLIEKTNDTYTVCAELDKIYNDVIFYYDNIMSKIDSKSVSEILDDCYSVLISEYMKKTGIPEFKPKDDFEVLTKILKLRVG